MQVVTTQGTVLPGASGAPLFNAANNAILGVLTGGATEGCTKSPDPSNAIYYGRLDAVSGVGHGPCLAHKQYFMFQGARDTYKCTTYYTVSPWLMPMPMPIQVPVLAGVGACVAFRCCQGTLKA